MIKWHDACWAGTVGKSFFFPGQSHPVKMERNFSVYLKNLHKWRSQSCFHPDTEIHGKKKCNCGFVHQGQHSLPFSFVWGSDVLVMTGISKLSWQWLNTTCTPYPD